MVSHHTPVAVDATGYDGAPVTDGAGGRHVIFEGRRGSARCPETPVGCRVVVGETVIHESYPSDFDRPPAPPGHGATDNYRWPARR